MKHKTDKRFKKELFCLDFLFVCYVLFCFVLMDKNNRKVKHCGVEKEYNGTTISIDIQQQYRNMADGIANEPRAVALAIAAHKALGRTPRTTIVRGGTDGSRLTELGLPTPNLSSGQHNIHSPLEWACLDEMVAACEVGIEIVQQWAQSSPDD